MFERFTDQARQAVVHAHESAEALGDRRIRTQHVLLGLVETGGAGGRALVGLGASPAAVRERLVAGEPDAESAAGDEPVFTRGAKQLLERALREALHAGARSIDTTHLALALVRDRDSSGARVLHELGIDRETARVRVLEASAAETETTASGTQRARLVVPPAQLSPATQQMLQSSMRAAMKLGYGYLGRRYPPIALFHGATNVARSARPSGEQRALRPAVCSFCGVESPRCGALFAGATGALICERCVADPPPAGSADREGSG